MRLFLLACCYRICQGSRDPAGEQLFQVAERFVEVPPPSQRQENILRACFGDFSAPAAVVWWALQNPLGLAAANLRLFVGRCAGAAAGRGEAWRSAERVAMENEARAQCDLLRDIFGNPFRPLPPIRGKRRWEEQRLGWMTWKDGIVLKMAEAAYQEIAFDRLPVLADALEDAGCDFVDLLSHCRGPGPHVRGCWVVDLLLDKK
jgi:hypothetical protein